MNFAHSQMFHLIWLLILLGGLLCLTYRNYKAKLAVFIEHKLQPEVAGSLSLKRRIWKKVILLLALFFCILALARPRWGFEWQEVKRQGIDILIAMDASKSMLTSDIKPDRLRRTKLAVKDLLNTINGDRVGLIAFAGNAFLLCPLTVDYSGFVLSLNDLSPSTVPRGGTNIESAIQTAMDTFKDTDKQYKNLIIITDGEELEGDAVAKAREARKQGIKIYTIGVGTKEGELIQITNARGEKEFLKDARGNVVKSELNERLLRDIAIATDGIYVKSTGTQFGLDYIYENDLSKIEKREIESKMEKRYYERFQIPLALALILLTLEACIPLARKKKS